MSDSIATVKNILDQLVETQRVSDIHNAINWNLDQLLTELTNIQNTFKVGELTVTLLEKGILNAELIDLQSLEKIIAEGRTYFPKLEFPLKVSRYSLHHIVKVLTIQRLGHLKYIMVIPMTYPEEYEVIKLIAHPVKIGATSLVIPTLRNIILHNNDSYVITDRENIYSISNQQHWLLEIEPIYNKRKNTCEWQALQRNNKETLRLCNYKKIGQINDTLVIETDQNRIIYFSKPTKVKLGCPEKDILDTLDGLHEVPLTCDIITDDVFWPSKRMVTIDINYSDSLLDLGSTLIPVVKLNATSKVHDSLRDLIEKLPETDEAYTIDFDYYGLSSNEIQSYSIYAQTLLSIIVCINSILIIVILIKWIYRKKPEIKAFTRDFRDTSWSSRFKGIRDSLKTKPRKVRSSLNSLRSSVRTRGSNVKRIVTSPHKRKTSNLSKKSLSESVTPPRSDTSNRMDIATDTDSLSNKPPPYVQEMYPVLPRYN